MTILKVKSILYSIALIATITVFLSSCEKEDLSEKDKVEVKSDSEIFNDGSLESRNDNCDDWDAGHTVLSGNNNGQWYNNELGYYRFAWHSSYQFHGSGWSCGFAENDHRLYYTDSYFSNESNKHNIRVRDNYNNCGYFCKRSTPKFDYLEVTSSGSTIGPIGTKYLRVVLGSRCNNCIDGIVLVAK